MSITQETRTMITMKCNGPHCLANTPSQGDAKTVYWVEEELRKSDEALPDDAYRFFRVITIRGGEVNFCSLRCLKDAFKDYVSPLSPREERLIKEQEAKSETVQQLDTANQISINPFSTTPATEVK